MGLFVTGPGNGNRLRVRYYRCEPEMLVGKVWFGPDAEGAPGHAHNGGIAAVLDEAMEGALRLKGYRVRPVSVSVRFRQMLPLGMVCTVGAWVYVTNAHEVITRGLLTGAEGQTFAAAEGVYTQVDLSLVAGER